MKIIAFDSHKRYTLARVESPDGQLVKEERINHCRGDIAKFLGAFETGCSVAVETIGNWYWIVDEIEQAQMIPRLVHARKAKLMLGSINKTDKLDARGLNLLQRTGTLPTVWIPPSVLRDKRELPRTRMVIACQRTRLKNRIHSVWAKYGLSHQFEEISDMFGKAGQERMQACLVQLPVQTCYTTQCLLGELDSICRDIKQLEKRMEHSFETNEQIELLMTLPGVGFILAVVICLEIGDVGRFNSPQRLASYSGTVPRVHASGDKVRFGKLRPDTNHYLKWAFSEAANTIAVHRRHWPHRHVCQLYTRIRQRKGHAKAVGAISRHLAEASYWMLKNKEGYKERGLENVSLSAV